MGIITNTIERCFLRTLSSSSQKLIDWFEGGSASKASSILSVKTAMQFVAVFTIYHHKHMRRTALYLILSPSGWIKGLYPKRLWHWKRLAREPTRSCKFYSVSKGRR